MRKCLILLAVAAFAALPAISAPATRGATFTRIGFIDNPGPYPASSVWDMNPQGTLFVVSPSPFFGYFVQWTRESGWGAPIGAARGFTSTSLSRGGLITSNGVYPGSDPAYPWPAMWTGVEDGWNPIPSQPDFAPCGNAYLTGYGMGGEGDYITGLTWQGCSHARAFKWDKATDTTVELGTPNGGSTRGNAITRDGSKVVGWGTMLFGLRRGAVFQNGTVSFLGDPNGVEPGACAKSGKPCTSSSDDPKYGCPGEGGHDGYCADRGGCQNLGTCVSNVCAGGSNAGSACTDDSQCPGACVGGSSPGAVCTSGDACAGTCVGPNAGEACMSDSECPSSPVCLLNPKWTDDLFKGEAYDVTPDGRYAVGPDFDFNLHWTSGYRANPDGTFTEMVPPKTWPYWVLPARISADGKTAVGRIGTFYDGYTAFFWREGLGTIDLQLFMEAQGIEGIDSFYLYQTNAVSADGTIIAGLGINSDFKIEGWIIDIKKVWVCHNHVSSGRSQKEGTLSVDLDSAAAHLAHGDVLGTCESQHSGAAPQAVEHRRAMASQAQAMFSPMSPEKFSEQSTPLTPFTGPKYTTGMSSNDRLEPARGSMAK